MDKELLSCVLGLYKDLYFKNVKNKLDIYSKEYKSKFMAVFSKGQKNILNNRNKESIDTLYNNLLALDFEMFIKVVNFVSKICNINFTDDEVSNMYCKCVGKAGNVRFKELLNLDLQKVSSQELDKMKSNYIKSIFNYLELCFNFLVKCISIKKGCGCGVVEKDSIHFLYIIE